MENKKGENRKSEKRENSFFNQLQQNDFAPSPPLPKSLLPLLHPCFAPIPLIHSDTPEYAPAWVLYQMSISRAAQPRSRPRNPHGQVSSDGGGELLGAGTTGSSSSSSSSLLPSRSSSPSTGLVGIWDS